MKTTILMMLGLIILAGCKDESTKEIAQDPRVLKVESYEIVQAVKENGVPVEYVLFEDEGHGFVKKENQIEAYGRIKDFLDIYLKGEGLDGIDQGQGSGPASTAPIFQ